MFGVYELFYEVVPFFFLYIIRGFVLIFEVSKFGCAWFVFQFVCFWESLFFSCTSVYLGEIGMAFVDNWVVGKEMDCYWLSNDNVGLVGNLAK